MWCGGIVGFMDGLFFAEIPEFTDVPGYDWMTGNRFVEITDYWNSGFAESCFLADVPDYIGMMGYLVNNLWFM